MLGKKKKAKGEEPKKENVKMKGFVNVEGEDYKKKVMGKRIRVVMVKMTKQVTGEGMKGGWGR